jgi:hypothetical protein
MPDDVPPGDVPSSDMPPGAPGQQPVDGGDLPTTLANERTLLAGFVVAVIVVAP